MREIVIRIQIPDDAVPVVDYEDGQPYLVDAPPPPVYDRDEIVRPPVPVTPEVPHCPQHGPMTFHQTKKDGTPMPRYSCDSRLPDGSFCKTRMVMVK